ncbi:response regulator [Nakamurella lactea]|uniref:response regulator n=1 Tax=Nakamurella lactea TaxID=459515 RepID=UPI0004289990|nr:response regulator transcription factor [Nakamurella lactea]
MADKAIRVVVADDQTAIREALATMLDLLPDIDVVGTAADGQQAVERVTQLQPDVLLTDLRMPVMDGAQATAAVSEQSPDTAVVLLTTYDDEESILSALQAGARGYLTKEAGRDEIASAIRTAASGQSVLDPGVQARLVRAVVAGQQPAASAGPTDQSPDGLTKRELEVVALIGQGLTNSEIARRLFVSEATVKTHINNLFAKAQLRDRAHAVRYAYTHGLAGG